MAAQRLRIAAGVIAIALSSYAATAKAADFDLYPVPIVFLPSGAAMTVEAQEALPSAESAKQFDSQFRIAFPDAVPSLNGRKLGRTFVASLRISRASTYFVQKLDGNVDAYAAITGTVRFFDLTTGQILQSYTTTRYLDKRFHGQPSREELVDMLKSDYSDLTSALVASAKASFKPYAVSAIARKAQGDLVVLDQGVTAGIGRGDALIAEDGSGLQVSLSAAGYSTALKTLGSPKTGAAYSRFANRPLAELQRPRALLIPTSLSDLGVGQGTFTPDALGQMFIDGLGSRSPFNIVEVDPDYAQLRAFVESEQGVAGVDLRARVLPNYFIHLSISPPIFYVAPTNLAYKSRQSVVARAQAEVLSPSGRIVFAASGQNTITDEVTDGVAFDRSARAEIAMKNALADLAEKLAQAAKFESFDLPVRSVSGDTLVVDDAPGVLTVGASPDNLTDLGHVEGISGSVFAPTWQAHINEEHGSEATAGLVHPPFYDAAPPPRIGDTLHVERFSASGGRNTRKFKACGTDVSLGSIKLDGFNSEALVVFALNSGQETYEPEQSSKIVELLNGSGEFKKRLSDGVVDPALCVEPVQRVDPINETCDDHGVCRTSIALRLTYRIRKGGDIVFRSGLETTVESSAYFRSISSVDRDALISADLATESDKLLTKIVDQPSFKAGIAGL